MSITRRLNLIGDLALRKGATFRYSYAVLTDNGTPFDLTGCTAIAQIRKRPALPAVAAFTLNFQEPRINGVILMSVTIASTVRGDRYVWDLRLTLPNSDRWVPVEGYVDIRETISQDGTSPSLPPTPELSAEADEAIAMGQPIYLKANGHCGLAVATDPAKSRVAGFSVNAAAVGFICEYRPAGIIDGLSNLSLGSIYYLSLSAGAITQVAPSTGYVAPIGQALTSSKLEIKFYPTVRL